MPARLPRGRAEADGSGDRSSLLFKQKRKVQVLAWLQLQKTNNQGLQIQWLIKLKSIRKLWYVVAAVTFTCYEEVAALVLWEPLEPVGEESIIQATRMITL
uniref:Uncharacterized protein n=1 Tax=Oryza rufipogon TaxID=4529 RepID=A0A0E0NVX7_ORYRU